MRLCLVQITDMPPEFNEAALAMCKPSFEKVLHPDTEVVLKPARGLTRRRKWLTRGALIWYTLSSRTFYFVYIFTIFIFF